MVSVGYDLQISVVLTGKRYSALGRAFSDVGSTNPIVTSNSRRTEKANLIG